MKAYPITEGELGQLFGVGILATICFSGSAGLFGFALDVTKDIAFAPGLPPASVSFWDAARTFSWFASGALFLVGIGFLVRRHSILNQIKGQTTFPEG